MKIKLEAKEGSGEKNDACLGLMYKGQTIIRQAQKNHTCHVMYNITAIPSSSHIMMNEGHTIIVKRKKSHMSCHVQYPNSNTIFIT